MTDQFAEAFIEVGQYGFRQGARSISKSPGCWESQVDKRWWIAINPHKVPTKCSTGHEVPPVSVYIQYNGWPAGELNPRGGWIAAGEGANEDTFIEALRAK